MIQQLAFELVIVLRKRGARGFHPFHASYGLLARLQGLERSFLIHIFL